MTTHKTKDEIFQTVKNILCESLLLKPDDVCLESKLVTDLNIDSLDLLDLVFNLERVFGIKLMDSELDQFLRGRFAKEDLADGFIKKESIEKMSTWIPALKKAADQHQITPAELINFISVESIVILLERKLT
ncbi:MAG: acyl carrier protein [Deltaproteobacteria bacterium]|nr:acyl carrier protein [Deltaproteobacteria bacterium]